LHADRAAGDRTRRDAVGAAHDLVFECVATGRASEAPALEEDIYGAVVALLMT
jgi:hypothetical protein